MLETTFDQYLYLLQKARDMEDLDLEAIRSEFEKMWNDRDTKYYIYESDSDPVWSYEPLDNEDEEGDIFSELPILGIYDVLNYPPTKKNS